MLHIDTTSALHPPLRNPPPPLRRLPNLGPHRESHAGLLALLTPLATATTTTLPVLQLQQQHARTKQRDIQQPRPAERQHISRSANSPPIPLLPLPLRRRNRLLPYTRPGSTQLAPAWVDEEGDTLLPAPGAC